MKRKVVYSVSFMFVFAMIRPGIPVSLSEAGDKRMEGPLPVIQGDSEGSITDNEESQERVPRGTEGAENTFYGYLAGQNNTGSFVTFIGAQAGGAGGSDSYGDSNTFVGHQSGWKNTYGTRNTFFGEDAGQKNDVGSSNAFFGEDAGKNNTRGAGNAFFGEDAGYENTIGKENSFFGHNAGRNNGTGIGNAFFGKDAGLHNTNGYNNAFFGYSAGKNNEGGFSNAFFGYGAGHNNVDGYANTFFGEDAGYTNSGNSNAFFGYEAGREHDDGSHNAFFGAFAGWDHRSGKENVFVGSGAGFNNHNGNGNVFLGHDAGRREGGSNTLYIDNSDTLTPLIYGEFDNDVVKINGNFTAIATSVASDRRWKKNIQPLRSPLDKITGLQGVSYEWKVDEYDDLGFTEGKQVGLVAQAVERVLPELVSEDRNGYKSVSYSKLTAVLVEAVKELNKENERQDKLIKDQSIQFQKRQAEIEKLQAIVKDLKG